MKTSFPKSKIKILLLEGIHPNAVQTFAKYGYTNVELLPNALPEDELCEKIKDVHLVGIRSKTQMNAKVLTHAKKLWAVGCFCIGTNQVDLAKAKELGIAVFNSPYSNTRSVAELVIAETIMLLRGIPQKNAAAHKGIWQKTAKGSFEVRHKVMGIIGYGHIGSQVSVLAEAMGLQVYYYDIIPKLPMGTAKEAESLEELLAISDVVTLHVPETPSTKMMVDANFVANMKEGSILLNLSRGTVVAIEEVTKALESKKLAGAAFDVYPVEPRKKGGEFTSSLQGFDNVILTPHIGGSTQEAQENIGRDAAQKLSNYLDSGMTVGSHSVPELSLPTQKDTHRILHIHKNVRGVLSSLNTALSNLNVNILGQYLKTNETIGYVVLDVDKTEKDNLLAALKQVDHTIKVRLLY